MHQNRYKTNIINNYLRRQQYNSMPQTLSLQIITQYYPKNRKSKQLHKCSKQKQTKHKTQFCLATSGGLTIVHMAHMCQTPNVRGT